MGKWLDVGKDKDLDFDELLDHMETLGIRKGLASTILQIEQGKITGDIVEDSRPEGASIIFDNKPKVSKTILGRIVIPK